MSIRSIYVERSAYESLGVGFPELPLEEPLKMTGLGPVVLLAGPNGGGKSRLLRMVPELVKSHLNAEGRALKATEQSNTEEDVRNWTKELERLSQEDPRAVGEELQHARTQLTENERKLKTLLSRLEMTELIEVGPGRAPTVVEFVPKVANLSSPADVPDSEVDERASRMSGLGGFNAQEYAPAYLRGILRAALLAGEGDIPAAERTKALEAKRTLLELMGRLLGGKVVPALGNSLNLEMKGGARSLLALSPGQQVLFQFACMLHAQGHNLANCIVLMDEPENHLHPKVLLEVVDSITASLGGGQLWIATHSVPLVAHLASRDASCLWLVEDGKVSSAKRGPTDVLYSLMGGADATGQLGDFLRLPEQYATLRFLAQCLEPPGVVGADVADPQTTQIRDIVVGCAKGLERRLRLLDYGAGKARLLRTLAEGPQSPSKWLDYHAFDPDPTHEEERRGEIARVYDDAVNRSLDDKALNSAGIDAGSVDIIVMCNVLHEIHPDEWRRLFGATGLLSELLQSDGHLLIVEDYGISVGERAHPYGFLLLADEELVKLFDIKSSDREGKRFARSTPSDKRFKDRLVAHLVGAACVQRFSAGTQRAAIQKLFDRMSKDLKSMLETNVEKHDARVGRDYARTAQLMANARLWLDDHP